MTNDEMMRFNKEVVNKIFTALLNLSKGKEMPRGASAFCVPHNWDAPEIDPLIEKIFSNPTFG